MTDEMVWTMEDAEFAAVLALSPDERYAYFIRRVAEQGLVWSLGGADGWVLFGDAEGRAMMPVWPHPRFAAACAVGPWAASAPRPLPVHIWRATWLPGLARDHRLIAVFLAPDGTSVAAAPEQVADDIANAMGG